MVSLLLLFLSIILSMIFVRIGAIALELTGLPEDQSAFQALSAYSNAGYTTTESEYVLSHPQRRKIIRLLIKVGSAGIITTIATLGGTLISSQSIAKSISSEDYLFTWLPLNISQTLLIIAVLTAFLILKATYKGPLARFLKEIISLTLLKRKIVKPVSFEEVLVNGNGAGVFQIEITEKSPLVNKTIRETQFKKHHIQALYVNRLSESYDDLGDSFKFEEGDILVVYGPITPIHDYCTEMKAESEKEKAEKENAESDALCLLEQAPDFLLQNQRGEEVGLRDFLGKKNLVMVFYPKDQSFFCTTQLKDFSQHLDEIRKLDSEVVGINQESKKSHAQFCDNSHLNFSLLSDTKKEVAKAYKTLIFGGLLVERTVYIIDRKGIIRYAKRGKPSTTEILAELKNINENEKVNQ